jgi:hypothetical protein
MAMTPAKELLNRWTREELPLETAVGQLLQHLVATRASLDTLQQAAALLQAQIDNLQAAEQPGSTSRSKAKVSPKR